MKELATIAAVLCVAVIAVIAAPRSAIPTAQDGLGDGDPVTPSHRAAITIPSRPADFQYGLTGNDWWAAQAHKVAHAGD